ncbi:MAG: YbeD family protein [Pseudomonadota bacterium]
MSYCALDNPPPLEFPCEYPIKIMGEACASFEAEMVALIREHAPNLGEGAVSLRPSKGGKYVSMTIALRAESREQVDAITMALRAHPKVLMSI